MLNLSFPEFVAARKRSVLFINLVFVIQQLLEFQILKVHAHFSQPPPKKLLKQLLAFLNFYQHVKINLFHSFLLDIQPILES